MNDNYAIYLLESALRDEITFRQQACELLHSIQASDDREAFGKSLRLADQRIPQLHDAIRKLKAAYEPKK